MMPPMLVYFFSTGFIFALISANCSIKFSESTSGIGIQSTTFNNVTYCQYLGVRYATARRFENPTLYHPKESENYTESGSVCPQMNDFNFATEVIGAEDCLFLNVHTPKVVEGKQLPVLVFIHGGSFTIGSSTFDVAGTDLLVENDIIVVTLNYRLDVLGFLHYPKFNITGNYGLKDQQAALKWINRHIQFFGGNPNKVTLMGQSAGASAVNFHLYSERSRELFQQAALISGSMLCPWAFSYRPDLFAKVYLQQLEITSREQLIEHDLEDLFFLYRSHKIVGARWMPAREEGGDSEAFLTFSPEQLLMKNLTIDVPLLVGVTKTEFELINIPNVHKLILEEINVPKLISKTERSRIEHYTESTVNHLLLKGLINRREDFNRNVANLLKTNFPIEHFLNTIMSKGRTSQIFVYRFDYDGKFNRYKNEHFEPAISTKRYGAVHGDDLSYIFTPYNISDALERKEEFRTELKVHERMSEMVANFVKFGNPSLEDFHWKAFNEESDERQFARIDENFEMIPTTLMDPYYYDFCVALYECLYFFNCSSVYHY